MTQESQSSERPLLTIAIPTYNRSEYLTQLLEILAPQLSGESRVNLVISDNASTDDTPTVVESFREEGLALTYIRNETNLGSDRNFLQCFEQSRGKYLWLFSDDDIIVPGGISRILALLAVEDYGLAFISTYEFRGDYVAEIISDRFGRFAEMLPDGLQLVQRVGTMITFISAIIVNKDYYSTTTHQDLHEFIGTNLMLLGWVCPVLATSSRTVFVLERLVAGRGEIGGGWGPCQVFGVNLKRVADATLGNRPDIAAELFNRTLQDWFPGMIMGSRRGTGKSLKRENMREILEPIYRDNWRYWTFVYPVIALPLSLARLWYSIICFTNRFRRVIPRLLNYIVLQRTLVRKP
jgi:glycosyltransferase involved in cell wall biosynthesis